MKKMYMLRVRLTQSDADQLKQLSQVIRRTRSEAVRVAIGIAYSLFANNPSPEGLPLQAHNESVTENENTKVIRS